MGLIIFLLFALLKYASSLDAVLSGVFPHPRREMYSAFDRKDQIYVAGGYDKVNHHYYDELETYDITTGNIQEVAKLPNLTNSEGAIANDGSGNIFYFVWAPPSRTMQVLKINPVDNSVTPVSTNLPSTLHRFSIVSDNKESIYIFGGSITYQDNHSIIYHFNTTSYEVKQVGNLPRRMDGLTGVWYDNSIFIFGDWMTATYPDRDNPVFRFTPSTGGIEVVKNLDDQLWNGHAVLVGDIAYIFSGFYFIGHDVFNFHYAEFNLKTFEYGRRNIDNLPGDMQLTSAVYVEETQEFVTVGTEGFSTGDLSGNVYRIQH